MEIDDMVFDIMAHNCVDKVFPAATDDDEWEDGDEYEDVEDRACIVSLASYLAEIDETINRLRELKAEVHRLYGAE
jgi:hypothetical protein